MDEYTDTTIPEADVDQSDSSDDFSDEEVDYEEPEQDLPIEEEEIPEESEEITEEDEEIEEEAEIPEEQEETTEENDETEDDSEIPEEQEETMGENDETEDDSEVSEEQEETMGENDETEDDSEVPEEPEETAEEKDETEDDSEIPEEQEETTEENDETEENSEMPEEQEDTTEVNDETEDNSEVSEEQEETTEEDVETEDNSEVSEEQEETTEEDVETEDDSDVSEEQEETTEENDETKENSEMPVELEDTTGENAEDYTTVPHVSFEQEFNNQYVNSDMLEGTNGQNDMLKSEYDGETTVGPSINGSELKENYNLDSLDNQENNGRTSMITPTSNQSNLNQTSNIGYQPNKMNGTAGIYLNKKSSSQDGAISQAINRMKNETELSRTSNDLGNGNNPISVANNELDTMFHYDPNVPISMNSELSIINEGNSFQSNKMDDIAGIYLNKKSSSQDGALSQAINRMKNETGQYGALNDLGNGNNPILGTDNKIDTSSRYDSRFPIPTNSELPTINENNSFQPNKMSNILNSYETKRHSSTPGSIAQAIHNMKANDMTYQNNMDTNDIKKKFKHFPEETVNYKESQDLMKYMEENNISDLKELSKKKNDDVVNDVATSYAEELGNNMLDDIKKSEPEITRMLNEIKEEGNNRELVGLEYRFKSAESLNRKITTKAMSSLEYQDGMTDIEKNEALKSEMNQSANNIHDALRYTMCCEEENFTDDITSCMDHLVQNGYQIKEFKNTFGKDIYKGINSTLEAPDGTSFELQFHTPQSFHVKDKINHAFYEIYRNPSANKNVKSLCKKIMIKSSSKIKCSEKMKNYKITEALKAKYPNIEQMMPKLWKAEHEAV